MNLYYGNFHALKDIKLDMAAHEITAFIGPSGCGKSTFLKSLNRMNDLVEGCKITGDIRLDGEDIYAKDMDIKKDYTIIMVTHNMQQAARVSDKTVFFLLGEIIESGETEQMFSMPKDKRTEDYITGRFG